MLRFRAAVVVVVALSALALGGSLAFGHWHWNSELHVGAEGVTVRTVWEDDIPAGQHPKGELFATIRVTVPRNAFVEVHQVEDNEKVTIKRSKHLECGPGGMEMKAEYKVKAKGKVSGDAEVTVFLAEADGSTPLSNVKTGGLNEWIKVSGVVPGASC